MQVHIKDIKMVSLSELRPHPKNPNKHSKEQISRLAKILEYQGWRYPIKVSNRSGFITSGHGRLLAAKHLGLDSVPVSYQDYTDDDAEYADIVSDNAIASWADLDLSAINSELANCDPSFDIDLLGIEHFKLDVAEHELAEKIKLELEKKYSIQVNFPNDMEMMDIHDDLASRGYIVRIL